MNQAENSLGLLNKTHSGTACRNALIIKMLQGLQTILNMTLKERHAFSQSELA